MKKIGLALSGGGFRASLFHLGLTRFLRDAGILSNVSHITSVSGGSVTAAHLVLNWDRYNGSAKEFDAASSELLSFIRLDVRNRIMRRFPLNLPRCWGRRLLGRSTRKLTRTGLLEHHYEKYLYGDVSLFELPDRPQLHILATNLSEGCLCSFNRDGLLMVRRHSGGSYRIDRIHAGLATVAMAVTASSAFPAFFPPIELTATDIGAAAGEFTRQGYTDGGIFDNLGVRMFRYLERPILAESPLSREDFFEFDEAIHSLQEASKSSEETPLRRLAQVLRSACAQQDPVLLTEKPESVIAGMSTESKQAGLPQLAQRPPDRNGDGGERILSGLWNVIRHYQFQLDPIFVGLRPLAPEAEALLQVSRLGGRALEANDQLWLNRHLLEAAFRAATGHACFRRLDSGLDGVLVSDVGKHIEAQGNRRAGGLIRTALRASDILMDRVWQLETETFQDTPGFVFAPMTELVEPTEDPTAPHPEIQRLAAGIRTDLDRFSPLEVSSLVRHGYCVGRKACRAHPELFGADLPANAPWDPVPGPRIAPLRTALTSSANGTARQAAATTVEARTLQASAFRRIWSTLLDYRDWASYIYVPIIIPILVLLPYFTIKAYQRSHRLSQLIDSLSQGSPDLDVMSRLLTNPIPTWIGEPAQEVSKREEPSVAGFEVLQDSRILDLRNWNPTSSGAADSASLVYGYRRLKVIKRRDHTGGNLFRVDALATSPKTQIRFPPQQVKPQLHMSRSDPTVDGERESRWHVSWNFDKVPAGEYVDLIYEHYSPAVFLRREDGATSVAIHMQADTAEVTRWILMPAGQEYSNFRILRYENGKPESAEPVKVVSEYMADDHTILAYKLLSAKAGYTYEVRWFYK
jgi:predicted acylesterase/phospholipase RssA